MTLLREVQREAVDGSGDLSSLLRKCLILAVRLKNNDFKKWVKHELDGYPENAALPDYRKTTAQSLGHFVGPFGSGARNAPIPMGCIPKEYHEHVSSVQFREGVSALQNTARNASNEPLQSHWSADLVAICAHNIYQNMTLMQAWMVIAPSTIVGILDTVRNRILTFALEIESQDPNAGEGLSAANLSTEKVGNVFHTVIMGNVGNLSSGGTGVQQVTLTTVKESDLSSLKSYLEKIGIPQSDVQELESAIATDPKPSNAKLGKRVAGWMGKMITKAAQGALNVSTTVASEVLSKACRSTMA